MNRPTQEPLLKKSGEAKGRKFVDYRLIDGHILLKIRMTQEKRGESEKVRGDLFLILTDKDDHETFFGDEKIPVGDGTLETVFNCVFSVKQFVQFSQEIGESIRQIAHVKKD